jgi:hypothetical protein
MRWGMRGKVRFLLTNRTKLNGSGHKTCGSRLACEGGESVSNSEFGAGGDKVQTNKSPA